MENSQQTSGSEHVVNIATSSEDFAMHDQGKPSTSSPLAAANI